VWWYSGDRYSGDYNGDIVVISVGISVVIYMMS